MIKTLSPYYINIPFVDPTTTITCISYTLKIYVWNGAKTSAPTTPSYVMTKVNQTNSNSTDKVNIARLLNDFIDFKPRVISGIDLINADNQVWCKTTVSYDGGAEQLATTQLCVKGYSYGMGGENEQLPTNKILLQGDEFKVNRSGTFILPVLANELTPNLNAVIKSYPSNEINTTLSVLFTNVSSNLVQNICIDISEAQTDEYIEITYNSKIITLLITDECRYTPLDIAFQNKEGALQTITFFKLRTESMEISSEMFEADRGQPLEGSHQYVTYNVQGKSKFRMNSGFVSESMNETFKQLLLSERVWAYEKDLFVPLKLGSKSIEYKSRVKDRLVNYEIEFEYAFNEVNNI